LDECLPLIHIAIGNLKTFLLGDFHGVSRKYLQEYPDEFSYRFNGRCVKQQTLNRLVNLGIIHAPVKSTWAKLPRHVKNARRCSHAIHRNLMYRKS
jgi:hypothetical protein